jgi:hypothetical protein
VELLNICDDDDYKIIIMIYLKMCLLIFLNLELGLCYESMGGLITLRLKYNLRRLTMSKKSITVLKYDRYEL